MSHPAAPTFYFIVGAPGAGKSSQIEFVLHARPPRFVVFDIEHEYGKHGRVVTSTEALKQALIAAHPSKPVALIYQPPGMEKVRERFDKVCELVFAASDLVFIVDELADVDDPNPHLVMPHWALVLRRGRKRHLRIIAGTQRPADCNKRLRSFATRLRVGMLADHADQVQLARFVGVDQAEVAQLGPCEWIERDRLGGVIERGRIRWVRGKPMNEPRPAPTPPVAAPPAAPPVTKKMPSSKGGGGEGPNGTPPNGGLRGARRITPIR